MVFGSRQKQAREAGRRKGGLTLKGQDKLKATKEGSD
ncbi:hypothetical protein CCACVL1_15362 [Corchorus capsularis]|uniref:Uncharacterized protein n=1 Tax=Corchorus capsularis TaxID=210143 RepID=A0A1R3I2V7_COCAP|nr:hypothetical protein CCACVL1_15362 [Corchorus capsularis]